MFGVMAFVFQSNHYICWGPACQDMTKHLAVWKKLNEFFVMFGLNTQLLLYLLFCLGLNPPVFALLSSNFHLQPTVGEN